MHSSLLLAGSVATLVQAASVPIFNRATNSTKEFSWTGTTPTRDLQWHDCDERFKCARLEVPLDWSEPTKNLTAAIGLVKLPATVPDNDPTFGGSVLLNPGGPSGSGTQIAYLMGELLQGMIAGERNFEIIGFDPRGVNVSTPHADCYKGDEVKRQLDAERFAAFAPIEEGPVAFAYHYANALATSELCEKDGVDSIWGHLNTASVARDMVEIIDRIDDLRWKESGKAKPDDAEKARLQYIGISYGSYLGNVFASMFPERVGKVMVDAIVDPEEWSKATWQKNLLDSEAILEYFYEICFNAGEDCPIFDSADEDWSDIKKRVDALLDEIDVDPIPVVHDGRANLITGPAVRQVIFGRLYTPRLGFEMIANSLASLFAGNYTDAADTFIIGAPVPTCGDNAEDGAPPAYTWPRGVQHGVICTDASANLAERNMSFYEDLLETALEQAPSVGAHMVAAAPLGCAGRKIRAPYSFAGPFTTPEANENDPNTPATPLLIMSSRLDPITPLANAVAMQKQHAGSALLIQESAGHGVLGTATPTVCAIKVMQEFFNSGKLPKNGTVCEDECQPTIPVSKSNCSFSLQARDGIPHNLDFHFDWSSLL